MAPGAFRAAFAPSGDRLTALFAGKPGASGEGRAESEGFDLYLGLLSWPSGQFLATRLVGTRDPATADLPALWELPTPTWSPGGSELAFWSIDGGLSLMDRDGHVQPILAARTASWVGWSAAGDLALLVDEQLWLLRGFAETPAPDA